ncbi:hypothetical protein AALC17_07730 [Oscillospiraceae bacterium 38-13]
MGERILELALAVSGGGAERALLEPLCRAAETAWRNRLREGVTAEDCGEALPCAAAFTAAAGLMPGGGGSFSAGDVSVTLPGGGERTKAADGLLRAAERLMEPYVRAEGLWVKGVEG